jgi:hypothetical protein
VEAHLAECEACRAKLRRSQTGALALDASTVAGPPVLVASVDGLVDPAVAAYVQRVA